MITFFATSEKVLQKGGSVEKSVTIKLALLENLKWAYIINCIIPCNQIIFFSIVFAGKKTKV